MPENFRCEQCGKTFPTEGDVSQHVQTMHAGSGVADYGTLGKKRDETEDTVTPTPMPPKGPSTGTA
jgi:hypothetical protein